MNYQAKDFSFKNILLASKIPDREKRKQNHYFTECVGKHLIATVLEFLYLIATLSSLLIAGPCNLTVIRWHCLLSVVIFGHAKQSCSNKTMNWNFASIDRNDYNRCSSQSWALSEFILFKFKKISFNIYKRNFVEKSSKDMHNSIGIIIISCERFCLELPSLQANSFISLMKRNIWIQSEPPPPCPIPPPPPLFVAC